MIFALSCVACGEGEAPGDAPEPTEESLRAVADADGLCDVAVDDERTLLMRKTSVVDDPRATSGEWSLPHVLGGSTTLDADDLVDGWLSHYETTTAIGPAAVTPRSLQPMVDALGAEHPGADDFRLLGITYHPDPSAEQRAGELHFVYALVDREGAALPFHVMAEVALPLFGGDGRRVWGMAFRSLSALDEGSAYNDRLALLTEVGVRYGELKGLRTVEALLGESWEIRDFRLVDGAITPVALAQTPDLSFDGERRDELVQWVTDNTPALASFSHQVPASFLAGAIDVEAGFEWLDGTQVDADARFSLSLMSCNGCHSGTTGTAYVHVQPRSRGAMSEVSELLRGDLMRRRGNLDVVLDGC